MQTIVLLSGCTVLTYFMFEQIDFSWSNMVAAAPEGHFSVVKALDDPVMPWLGMFMVPFVGLWFVGTNQFITQRVLAARSLRDARLGAMFAGYLKFLPFFIMLLPGAMAISVLPDLPNGDMVFPTMVLEFLPIGFVGLVFAGLIAAILSSIDSALNSASTLVVVDFVTSKHPDMTPKRVAKYGRIATIVLMLIAAMWAPNIGKFGGLWSYLQQIFAIIVAPTMAVFLFGAFYKRGNANGAIWTLILGTVIGFGALVMRLNGLLSLHFLYTLGAAMILCCVIFVVASQFTPAPSKEVIDRFTFRKELLNMDNDGVSWYEDYRYHSAIILIITSLFVVVFW
jgi:SSS family solute:Na+ symporter